MRVTWRTVGSVIRRVVAQRLGDLPGRLDGLRHIRAVQEMVPHARLILDRFHVQRLAQDALDETRRDELPAAASKDQKAALKGTRWPLLKIPTSAWGVTILWAGLA